METSRYDWENSCCAIISLICTKTMTDGEPPYHAQGIIAEIHKCGTSWTREFMKQKSLLYRQALQYGDAIQTAVGRDSR